MVRTTAIHDRFAAIVPEELQTRRIALFLAIAFGLHWLPAAYFFAEGVTVTDRNFSTAAYNAVILVASFTPALATVVTRWLTGEPLDRAALLLAPELRTNWRTYAAAAVVPLLLAVVGAAVYFAVLPRYLAADPLAAFASNLPVGGDSPVATLALGVPATLASLAGGAVILLGEELGWRAYLLPKLSALGRLRATVLTGILWGVWHWPFVYLGVNYPDAPWLGMAAMAWVTTLYGVFLAWATFRTGSVWPAAVGHAAFNTSSRWGPMVAEGAPNFAIGPTTGGLLGAVGWLAVAGWLLARSPVFHDSKGSEAGSATDRESVESAGR